MSCSALFMVHLTQSMNSFVSRHDRTQCVGILFAGEHVMLDYAPVTFQFCKLKKRVSSVAFT